MIGRRIAVALVLACSLAPAGAGEPFPYPLQLEVVILEEGSEGVREELERELAHALDRAGCYLGVEAASGRPAEEGDALLLRVAIEKLSDEMSFDVSIAERYSEQAPPDVDRQVTSWLEIGYRMELHLLPGSVPLRSKFQNIRTGYRPQLDEDPREENRIQAIDQIVRSAKGFACKGSPKKLRKAIDRARQASR